MSAPGSARRTFAAIVALWGAWKEGVSFAACALALSVAEHPAMAALFVSRGVLWLVASVALARGLAWGRPLFLGLWAFTAVGMTAWWLATDPMSSSVLFAVVSTAAAWGVWRDRSTVDA